MRRMTQNINYTNVVLTTNQPSYKDDADASVNARPNYRYPQANYDSGIFDSFDDDWFNTQGNLNAYCEQLLKQAKDCPKGFGFATGQMTFNDYDAIVSGTAVVSRSDSPTIKGDSMNFVARLTLTGQPGDGVGTGYVVISASENPVDAQTKGTINIAISYNNTTETGEATAYSNYRVLTFRKNTEGNWTVSGSQTETNQGSWEYFDFTVYM